jgi:hypothetical protein
LVRGAGDEYVKICPASKIGLLMSSTSRPTCHTTRDMDELELQDLTRLNGMEDTEFIILGLDVNRNGVKLNQFCGNKELG